MRLFYRIEQRPEMISMSVGAFADPTFPPPTVEIYAEKAQNGIGQ